MGPVDPLSSGSCTLELAQPAVQPISTALRLRNTSKTALNRDSCENLAPISVSKTKHHRPSDLGWDYPRCFGLRKMVTKVAQSDQINPATQQQVPGLEGSRVPGSLLSGFGARRATLRPNTQHSLLGIKNCTFQLDHSGRLWMKLFKHIKRICCKN